MTGRGAYRLRLALRDLGAAAAFMAMSLSGQVPSWTAALFVATLGLALLDVRPFARHVRESALALLGSVLVLWAMVASGHMDLVVAACACAALLTAQRMLSGHGAAVDQQVALAGLLMLSGGAALSADLGFLPCLCAYTLCTSVSLALGEVERAAPAGAAPPAAPSLRAAAALTAVALVGGVLFFVAFPRLSWNLAARRGGNSFAGAVVGLGDRVRLGGSGELKSNPRIVLRAQLDPDPGVDTLGAYWVAYRFDAFDGLEWRGQARPGRPLQRLTLARGSPGALSQHIELLPAYGSRTVVAIDHPVQFSMATAQLSSYSVRTALVPVGDESVRLDGAASGFSYYASSALRESRRPTTPRSARVGWRSRRASTRESPLWRVSSPGRPPTQRKLPADSSSASSSATATRWSCRAQWRTRWLTSSSSAGPDTARTSPPRWPFCFARWASPPGW